MKEHAASVLLAGTTVPVQSDYSLYSLTTPRLPCWRGHVSTLADGPIRVQGPCLGAKHFESRSSSSNCSSPQLPESPLAAGVLPAEFPDLMACRQVILSVPVQISDSMNIIILTREHVKWLLFYATKFEVVCYTAISIWNIQKIMDLEGNNGVKGKINHIKIIRSNLDLCA